MASFEATISLNQSRAAFIERIHKELLTEEAKSLTISNLQSKLEILETYWEKFESTLEKLIATHLEQLLSPPAMTAHSAKELNAFLTTVSGALNALETLGSPTAYWDQVHVHTVSQRLSSKLCEAWEVKSTCDGEYRDQLDSSCYFHEAIHCQLIQQATSAKVHHGTAQPTQRSRPVKKSAPTGKVTYSCSMCEADHYLTSCSSFRQLTVPDRREVIERRYLCYNCLGRHSVSECRSKTTCQYCGKLHHSILHRQPSSQPARPAQQRQQTSSTQLKPVPVQLNLHPLQPTPARHGQTRSKAHQLRLPSPAQLVSQLLAQLKISILVCFWLPALGVWVSAYALGQLSNSLSAFSSSQLTWDHLGELHLADPDFFTPAPIDILLGADVYGQLILPQVITSGPHSPSAQVTRLGWIVFGPTEGSDTSQKATSHLTVTSDDLNELFTKFWIQEEVPETPEVQLNEEEAQSSSLGDSRSSTLACLHCLLKKLSRDEAYRQLYSAFLKEYEELDHMRRVSGSSISSALSDQLTRGRNAPGMTLAHEVSASGGLRVPGGTWSPPTQSAPKYFFPHHGVLRASSETTKLRVVFNGSNKTSSGQSLNYIMHTGEKLQKDISDVVLFSRRKRLIFMTDITKMFRQIRVHPEDWPLQQILWTDSNGDIVTYQLTKVTYCTRSAPFLFIRVAHQLVEDEGSKYPLAVEPLIKGKYVDDICGGADSVEELLRTAHQVTRLCLSGGFSLAKWHSNSPALLTSLQPDSTSQDQRSIENSITKILGVPWHPGTDNFQFSVTQPQTSSIMKRTILWETAQLFDPRGFSAPVVVRAKILLQALWIEKQGWDEPVSPTTAQRWRRFRDELTQLSEVTIPRWLGLLTDSVVEVHGFSDASQVARSAVVYLKVFNNGKPQLTLVCSKTKVAPLKRLTIPPLELTAALLLAKLTKYVKDRLNLTNATACLWTDSSVTLTWISSHSSRWKEFVKNRVSLIQDLT
ncbi:uncharacterized protein [Fopius arisanus]|uniref:Peptidase aspartic putative domain-containing protein n=1 Tax=Fopius arisanus TaxID=64838 RepID=A0A9R1TIA9_9HYME|nr:PREDICTED: uncharacterized protein LOC105270322 [Fopius arisanus]